MARQWQLQEAKNKFSEVVPLPGFKGGSTGGLNSGSMSVHRYARDVQRAIDFVPNYIICQNY